MILEIRIPDSLSRIRNPNPIREFLQSMVNRLTLGGLQYESNKGPDKANRYLSRLKAEVKAYEREGNAEQLYNIANYAYLEMQAPENKKYHLDTGVKSRTRRRFGGIAAARVMGLGYEE